MANRRRIVTLIVGRTALEVDLPWLSLRWSMSYSNSTRDSIAKDADGMTRHGMPRQKCGKNVVLTRHCLTT
jgi:hypothetical protein